MYSGYRTIHYYLLEETKTLQNGALVSGLGTVGIFKCHPLLMTDDAFTRTEFGKLSSQRFQKLLGSPGTFVGAFGDGAVFVDQDRGQAVHDGIHFIDRGDSMRLNQIANR